MLFHEEATLGFWALVPPECLGTSKALAAKSPTPVALEDTAFRNKSPALEAEMVLLRNKSDKSALSLLSSGTWLKLLFLLRCMEGKTKRFYWQQQEKEIAAEENVQWRLVCYWFLYETKKTYEEAPSIGVSFKSHKPTPRKKKPAAAAPVSSFTQVGIHLWCFLKT